MAAPRRLLAIASGGGHWVQLRRLAPAFDQTQVVYAGTHPGYASEVSPAPFYSIRDANRWNKVGLLIMLLQIAFIMCRTRPHVVITTGAAPGYFAVRLGKLIGARTIWIDSIANSGELSLSGKMAGKYVDAWLTQWEHLAAPDGPQFHGAVV